MGSKIDSQLSESIIWISTMRYKIDPLIVILRKFVKISYHLRGKGTFF